MHHLRGGARALGGLLGHREDVLDVGRHLVGLLSFLARLAEIRTISSSSSRDTRSMSSSALPAASDSCVPSTTPRVERSMAATASAGVGLNGLHEGGDSPRRVAGAFSQTLHFFRHHREAATGFTGRGGLDGGVQGQHVRLFRNVRDQLRDLADFL